MRRHLARTLLFTLMLSVLPASGRISDEVGGCDRDMTRRAGRARGSAISVAARGRWSGGNSRVATARAAPGLPWRGAVAA